MPLTDAQCRTAKPRERPYKLAESGGLYLYVSTTGHKSWRWKYRIGGKEKRLVFGPYPVVSLKDAKGLRDDAASLLRKGEDPGAKKSASEPAPTFKDMAARWHASRKVQWKPTHARAIWNALEAEIFPAIGETAIGEVTAPILLAALEVTQNRGAVDQAHRLRGWTDHVFKFAIAAGLATHNPASALSHALASVKKGRYPALIKLDDARAFLRAAEALPAYPSTRLASRLIALTAARPGTLRLAELKEFEGLDGKEPIWRVPIEKLKLDRDQQDQEVFELIVPLAPQAVETVKAAAEFAAGCRYLFPSVRHALNPMSENALNVMYRRVLGWEGRHVPHGWRSSFSTILNERAARQNRPGDRVVIDLMLGHAQPGVEPIYNRAAYMPRRRRLARDWADMLLAGFPSATSLLEGRRSG